MAWIKRNLYFLIGSLVALALMVCGGFFLFSQVSVEGQIAGDIEKQFAELSRLMIQNPNPGKPGEGNVDNVQAAKDQEAALRKVLDQLRPHFQRIPPIPDPAAGKVSAGDFPGQLDRTVAQIRRSAEQKSVQLPNNYYFTFQAQKSLMVIDAASVSRLSVSLGEIKVLCGILFDSGINTLERIRREAVSVSTDTNAPDYLSAEQKTIATPLAELTPYEVTFQCFSKELAEVLGNLASSPHGFVVQIIDVEPAAPMTGVSSGFAADNAAIMGQPQARPGGRRGVATPGARGATTFMIERPLRVTLLIQLVKPVAKK